MYKFATAKEHLLHFLTGTETPQHLTEREKVMIDKFLEFYTTVKTGVVDELSTDGRLKMGVRFEDLKENTIYSLYSEQFGVSNRVRLISFDHSILKRNLAFFQYVDRGHTQISKRHFRAHMLNEVDIPSEIDMFSIWKDDLETGRYVLTNTPHTPSPAHLGR